MLHKTALIIGNDCNEKLFESKPRHDFFLELEKVVKCTLFKNLGTYNHGRLFDILAVIVTVKNPVSM